MDLCGHEREIPLIPIPMSSSTYVGTIISGGGDEESKKQIVVVGAGAANNKVVIRYRECLKNHAAPMGGNATDGCGEFMPSGEEGTLEAFKCSACSCHRNFHRKEVEGEQQPSSSCSWYTPPPPPLKGRTAASYGGYIMPLGALPPPLPLQGAAPAAMIMPLGAASMNTSESDEYTKDHGYGGVMAAPTRGMTICKKRFRTKFTQEQKEKMLAFADKVGWRLQRQEETLVQHFCQEIGVKRRVLKVWMHNNKHNHLATTNNNYTPPQ